ncbi:hypothetical protein [Evansella halocellulosilytica]|uniref:hypothetical protein n=1 Tax=Evansella halocellulosilytica TaxID=2011013 RepID=UPI000BB71A09|nr:hypothetical protein [Evansella halocellulosilytica]
MVTRKMLLFIQIISLLLLLIACTDKYSEQVGYKPSQIHDQIPVPKNAEMINGEANNETIKESVFYKLNKIGGEQGLYPPLAYIEEIEEWGWEQLEEERMGGTFTFIKEDIKIWVIIDEDGFSIHTLDDTQK